MKRATTTQKESTMENLTRHEVETAIARYFEQSVELDVDASWADMDFEKDGFEVFLVSDNRWASQMEKDFLAPLLVREESVRGRELQMYRAQVTVAAYGAAIAEAGRK
jgi:hypothetical protein